MAVVYVREQGAILTKSYMQMNIQKGKNILKKIPLLYMEQLMVFGNVQISTQLLHYLLQQGIAVHYFTYGGQYLGETENNQSKNIFLRCNQFEVISDEKRKLEIASKIVEGKIYNQIQVIKKYRWNPDYDWKSELDSLEEYKRKISDAEDIADLMGLEGIASNVYFKVFAHMVKSDIRFSGRNRRPPKDPINAVLSLAYTFLTRDMCTILESQSFELYLGFLHGIRYGRKSLALDMIEVFRQPVIDRMVLHLFNKRMLTIDDFDLSDDIAEDGIYLNKDGFQKFCFEYEKWMTSKKDGTSWRMIMRQEAQGLRDLLQNGEVFIPWHYQ